MKTILKELKDIKSENCETIILNTHRTIPKRLLGNQSKSDAGKLVNRFLLTKIRNTYSTVNIMVKYHSKQAIPYDRFDRFPQQSPT